MLVFRTTVQFGATNPDLRDLGHVYVLDSIHVAQFKPISYISGGRIVIPFLYHFGTAESLTDRRRSARMPANHGVIRGKGLADDPMVKSIALDHIYRLYIASGRTCRIPRVPIPIFPHLWCTLRGVTYVSLCARLRIQVGGSCTNSPKQ